MIYLASPFSHPDPAVRAAREDAALRATVALFNHGRTVYSPIVYSAPLFNAGVGATGQYEEWEALDRRMIQACDMLWVLTIEGWRESKGIRAEVAYASGLNKPMRHVSLDQCLRGDL